MRKVVVFLLLLVAFGKSFSQAIVPRGSVTVTVQDARLSASYNLVIPRYQDTTSNVGGALYMNNLGLDSCGALIYTYSDATIWVRQCINGGKRWGLVGNFNGSDTVYVDFPLGVRRDSTGHQVIFIRASNGLGSGGVVTKSGCWTVSVSPAIYNLNYIQYTSLLTNLDIDTADATFPRKDLIIVDTFGIVSVLTGTPSSTPIAPYVNPSSQLVLTELLIPAAATCLDDITVTVVYDENLGVPTEFAPTTSGTITATFNNVDNPKHLTKAAFVSSYTDGSKLNFTHTALQDTVGINEVLVFWLYFNGLFTNQLQAQFWLNSVPVSNNLVLNPYFNPSDSNEYQNATIQLSSWTFSSPYFNKIVFTHAGDDTSGTKGYYMDWIQLQKGVANSSNSKVDSTKIISGSEYYYINGVAYLAGAVGGSSGIDSIRKAANSDSIKQYSGGTGTFAVRTQRVFNVKDYGAVGNGVTDATTSIQAAINACDAAGGGTVYFPDGIYIVGGAINAIYNSQLYIPYSGISSALRNHITIKGEGKPNFVPVGTGLAGGAAVPIAASPVIIKSSLTTFTTAGQAVFGTSKSGAAYNETFLSVENIAIQVKNNPSGTGAVVGGISYKNGSSLQCNNVVVYVDTSGFRSTLPSNDVTGIETPDNSSETVNSLQNTLVLGMRSGYKLGEHCLLNQAQAMTCYYGMYFKDGYHTSTSVRSGLYWCPYDIYIRGFCTLSNFQFDSEFQNISKWYDDVATIKDSANLAAGQVFYTIIEANVGKNNAKFLKSGGANLHTLTNDEGVASGSVQPLAIGSVVTSATAGSLLFAGTSGVLSQDNSNFFWNNTNKQLGIGTNSTSHKLEILSSADWDGIGITSSNTTTGARILLTSNSGASGHFTTYSSGIGSPFTNNTIVAGDNHLLHYAGKSNIFFSGGVETMRLFSNGSLGINTTTDSTQKLVVNGNGLFTGLFSPTITGNITSGTNLTLTSTSHATKGKILLGASSAFDEVNTRLGIGTASPSYPLHVSGSVAGNFIMRITNASTASGSGVYAGVQVENSSSVGNFFKYGVNANAYKNELASDLGFYNSGAGNISFLNDYSSGNINFAAGGRSAADMTIASTGRVGLGAIASPSAILNLPAGTTAASTAPLKFTAGSNLTAPEAGAVEFDGTHYYGTVGSTRYQLDQQTGSGGTVTSVSGTAPIVSSGGTTPAISIPVATSSVNGYLSSTDWGTFNNKQSLDTFSIWKRKGTVLNATTSAELANVGEPSVIRDSFPIILTGNTVVFKMYYTDAANNTNYAESLDGLTWAKYASNPVISNHTRNAWLKIANTGIYYLYASLGTSGTQLDRYTSTNGVTWTLASANVIPTSLTWNAQGVYNSHILIESGTWKIWLEGKSSGTFKIGYLESSDGITWTEPVTNPVLSGLGQGNPWVIKIGSTYWMWCGQGNVSSNLPSDIARYSSPDGKVWTASPGLVFRRSEYNDGAQNATGQVVDPSYMQVGNSVYMWYSASDNGASLNAFSVKLAVASMPLASLVATNEGDGSDLPNPNVYGTSVYTTALNIKGTNALAGTNSLLITDNSSNQLFKVTNNGNSFFKIFNVTDNVTGNAALTLDQVSTSYSEIQSSLFGVSYGNKIIMQRQGGTVSIGSSTSAPSAFNIGSSDQFQVNSSGAIVAAAGITQTGNITLSTAGNKLNIATGTNASVGVSTLVGGTVTVSTTAVTASSKIFLTDATTGVLTNVGSPTVGTIVAGTSFVINSTNVLDTSTVNWLIIN